jgi:drug/metabolite transporter (DMT)-like permease
MKKSGRGKRFFAEFGLFYAAAIWGSTFFIVKAALDNIDPVTLVAYRFLLAALGLAIWQWARKKPLLVHLQEGITLGILLWLLYVPQTIGLRYTTASNSGFITGLFVLFVPLFARFAFGKNPRAIDWLAALVSLSGLYVLTGGFSDVNRGDMLTLITAMVYALHILYADRYVKSGFDPIALSFQQFAVVGILSVLSGLLFGLPFYWTSFDVIGAVLFLAIFPTLSAFVIQLFAQRHTRPSRVSIIFAFEPVFAALFAWTLGQELFVLHRALGGLLIFAALLLSGLPEKSGRQAG